MKKHFGTTLRRAFGLVCLTLSCFLQGAETITILTTTTDLADITRQITGELAEVSSLCDGREDPHALTVRPSFIVKARTAQVWVRVGMELELGWEPPILRDCRNRRIQVGSPAHIDVSEAILPLDVPQGEVTRDQGDIHAFGNPHYWLDPLNGRLAARFIAARLAKLYPEHEAAFNTNLARFLNALDARMFGEPLVNCAGGARLWQWLLAGTMDNELGKLPGAVKPGGWYAALRPYAGAPVATYHRSWIYLLQRFQLSLAGELEPKPGIPPSPKHLHQLSESFQAKGVRIILQEPFYSPKAAALLAARLDGLKVLVCANSTGGGAGAGSYLEMLDQVISALAGALKE
ncbi:MAG: zinc ABC transporter substrate-binding protein [Oligosphaeraceae bacterium]|nr:zinc ABC transporter substrate-binding protein [Oligosphaeraceae bacterium]